MRTWFRSLDPVSRLAVVVWLALVFGVCGRVLVASPRSHTVYPIYVTAAQKWQDGEDLYGLLAPGLDVWRYHPVIAAGFVPWELLPEKAGAVLWRLLNLGVFFGGLIALRRRVLPAGMSLAWLALLSAPLCLHSFNNAQANLLLVGLMMFGVAAFAEGRWWRAALFLALATLLKCYPISLALLLTLFAPLRFGPRFVVLLGLGFLLPFVLQSSDYARWQYGRWFEVMQLDDRLSASLERCTRDVHMVCRVWLTEPSREWYRTLQAGTALLLAAGCWRLRAHPMRFAFAFDGGCLWMTLLGPATESCTYTLLGPTLAAGLLCSQASGGRQPPESSSERTETQGADAPRSPGFLLLLSAILFLYTTCAGAFPREWRFENAALQPIAGLLLAVVVFRNALPALIRGTPRATSAIENPPVSGRALVEVL